MTNCPRCEVQVNSPHLDGCTIGRCKEHGEQKFACAEDGKHSPTIWKGEYPGTSEAITRGWFAKRIEGKGWVQCEPNDADAHPDLNRVVSELIWDSDSESYK